MAIEDLIKTKRELTTEWALSELEAEQELLRLKGLYKEELKRINIGLSEEQANVRTNAAFDAKTAREQAQARRRLTPVASAAPAVTSAELSTTTINLTAGYLAGLGLNIVPTAATTSSDINIHRASSSSTQNASHSSSLYITYSQPTITSANPNGICFYRAIAISTSSTELNAEVVRLRTITANHITNMPQPDPRNIDDLMAYLIIKASNSATTFDVSILTVPHNITLTAEELQQQATNNAANIDNTKTSKLEQTALMETLHRAICIIKSNNSVSIIEDQNATGEPIFVYYHANNDHYDGITVNPGVNTREILNNLRNREDLPRPERLRRTI